MNEMKPIKLLLALTAILIVSSAAICSAGPLLDDYLNYARLGEHTAAGDMEVTLTTASPIGQTFRIAPGTQEIYRIGAMPIPEPDSWGEGEVVTLTLYDSPAKGKKLGSYSIDWRTNRISGLRNRENDRLLLWHLRANVEGLANAYAEFTVQGGDGNVRFRALKSGGYASGQGYQGGQAQEWDLAFQTHIKPVPDKKANLKRLFTEIIDIDYPPLAKVKEAVAKEDYETAIAETVKHFRNRDDLYDKKIMEVKNNPNADTTLPDLFLSEKLRLQSDNNIILPWRKQSYWSPDYLNYGKKVDPWFYGWGLVRYCWGAYSETGNPKYAKGGMEMLVQWMLDNNPNPKISGIEAPHEIWNELAAAGRAPGHWPYVFSRVYNYDGFSNDEVLMYILNGNDNAEFLYDSPVGGNWLSQAAAAAIGFGRDFPEFKSKDRLKNWGALKQTEVSIQTVRPDGTQHEAAIKYHAMVARRLKSLLEDHNSGVVKVPNDVLPQLKHNFELMYDWMAHTLQPNNFVVMAGDSWYENFSKEVAEVGKMINRPDFVWIGTQGKQGSPPKQASRAYPEGGYYIMRSDFGGAGRNYQDARQLYMHNGGWVGSHSHWDLTSLNLYAYGRTLVVDPGGMWTPPAGVPNYWASRMHSMMVPDGLDCKRNPGPTLWFSTPGADYFNSWHFGWVERDIHWVRRKAVFVKPDYYVVDDSASSLRGRRWDQNWNLLGEKVKISHDTQTVETTFPSGANLIVQQVYPRKYDITELRSVAPMGKEDGFVECKLVYFNTPGSVESPRYTTVLYPYKDNRPNVQIAHIKPDNAKTDKPVGARIVNGKDLDFVAWGEGPDHLTTFSDGKHELQGEVMTVRTVNGSTIKGYSAFNARRVVFNGRDLAGAARLMSEVDVVFDGTKAAVTVREAEPSVSIWVGNAKTITVNGKPFTGKAVQGYIRPFENIPNAIIVDDNSQGFKTITAGNEWELIGCPSGYDSTFTRHETDPGRHEEAAYIADIPAGGTYKLEVHIPENLRRMTDRMLYTVKSVSGTPVAAGGAVLSSKAEENGSATVMINQQKTPGKWVNLGTFRFNAGKQELLNAKNQTTIDGLYPTYDAIRLTPVK